MDGSSGKTNYATDKPSYAYSTATTEFDDALIQRGIVSHTQAMMGKGASREEAERLTELSKQQKDEAELPSPSAMESGDGDDDDDDDDSSFEDGDTAFMEKYRKERLAQLEREHSERREGRRFGEAIPIDRTQWKREVNEASQLVWVIVCLTSSDAERTGKMERAVKDLSKEMVHTKFVLIPAHQAIENDWPRENLPTLFIYRHGKMQKQLLGLPVETSTENLVETLSPILVDDWSNTVD